MCYTTIILVGTMKYIYRIWRKRIKWCHCQNSTSLIILKNEIKSCLYWKSCKKSIGRNFSFFVSMFWNFELGSLSNFDKWVFVSMQKSRNVWAPCIYIQWAENGKIVSSQDQKKTRETKCSFNFTKKLEICFFPNFSSLHGIFFLHSTNS